MDYKTGEIFLCSHDREMLAQAILTQISRISAVKSECANLGLDGYDFDWTISNYRAILKHLQEE